MSIILAIAGIWFYCSPYAASNLDATPDAVEYSVAPMQLLKTGRYEIVLEGHSLPPRYPPWFSTLVILPVYVLCGTELGNGIFGITVFAIAGVGFAWGIGRRVNSGAGGMLAAFALMFVPSYGAWATQIMTDIPCVALMLGTGLLFLHIRATPDAPRLLSYLGAGVIVGVTTLFRPTFAAMLLPFLLSVSTRRGMLLSRSVFLLIPMGLAIALAFSYNALKFGSPFRNGYHFWTPVPYDYPELVFSTGNLGTNLSFLAGTSFPFLFLTCLIAGVVLRARKPQALHSGGSSLRDLLLFFGLTINPILAFHLLYFFPADRFFLPLLAGTAVIAGLLVSFLVSEIRVYTLRVLLLAVALLVSGARLSTTEPIPNRRLAAERIRQWTPAEAIVISSVEPIYLEACLGSNSDRRIIPTSRDVEYAANLLAAKRVDHPEPPPTNWMDSRAAGLIRGGAVNAIGFVASEQIGTLIEEAKQGRRIFFETSFLSEADDRFFKDLATHFALTRVAFSLYELKLR